MFSFNLHVSFKHIFNCQQQPLSTLRALNQPSPSLPHWFSHTKKCHCHTKKCHLPPSAGFLPWFLSPFHPVSPFNGNFETCYLPTAIQNKDEFSFVRGMKRNMRWAFFFVSMQFHLETFSSILSCPMKINGSFACASVAGESVFRSPAAKQKGPKILATDVPSLQHSCNVIYNEKWLDPDFQNMHQPRNSLELFFFFPASLSAELDKASQKIIAQCNKYN